MLHFFMNLKTKCKTFKFI